MALVVAERNLGASFQKLLLWKHLQSERECHTRNITHNSPSLRYSGPWPKLFGPVAEVSLTVAEVVTRGRI